MCDLRQRDPRAVKGDILHDKDDLINEASDWVLQTPEFRNWYNGADTQLLWIKGDPGKGKTMMAIALINELSRRHRTSPGLVSYFFCQNTDLRLNNAISVLRGLIWMLATKHDMFAKPLRKEYKSAGPKLFEGRDTFSNLERILLAMLKIPNHGTIYLVVDALDECGSGLSKLLKLITNRFAPSCQVKWLITSRNYEEIERQLRLKDPCVKVSLEFNSPYVSRAVDSYIDIKVQELEQKNRYTPKLKEKVRIYLKENAEGTFLWVALACKVLQTLSPRKVVLTRDELPQGLDSIYERMMGQILGLKNSEDIKFCKCIIIAAIFAHRPLQLKELGAIADLPKELWEDLLSLEELVQICGSFLTIQKGTVYLVHQSAKDFFTTGNGSSIIPSGCQEEHGKIAYRSLDLMSHTLREDMCDLQKPGISVIEAQKKFSQSRFTHVGYACCYWVDHLAAHLTDASCDTGNQLGFFGNGGKVRVFLWKHLLHWLEVMSLLGKVSEGVLMFKRLQLLIDVSLLTG